MTRTNLGIHLSWLISCGSTQPPQPIYVPQLTQPADGLGQPLDNSSLSQKPVLDIEKSGNVQRGTDDDSCIPSESEFARPQQSASALNAQSKIAMARLQSGPKSSNKPRLLSESLPVSLQTPTHSAVRPSSTSLKDQYSAQWESRANGNDNQ